MNIYLFSLSPNTFTFLFFQVISNWAQQVQDHIQPGVLKLEIYHGRNRHDLLELVQNGMIDILLVPYQTLSADYGLTFGRDPVAPVKKKMKRETIFDIIFHRIILDEAVRIQYSSYIKSRSFVSLQLSLSPYCTELN